MALINLVPFLLGGLLPSLALPLSWRLVLLAFSCGAYLNSLLLKPVILPMIEKKTENPG